MNEQKKNLNESDSKLGVFPELTMENIEKVEEEVNGHMTYGEKANEKELKDYFNSGNNALNKDRNIVLHKIFLIDYTNSTNLYRQKKKITVFALAERITRIKDLDQKIRDGNIDIVKELAEQTYVLNTDNTNITEGLSSNQGTVNLFSFASKYCLYHNRICYDGDDYSIYDRVVANAIPHYLENTTQYSSEKCRRNMDYLSYHNYISEIIDLYGLTGKGIRRKLDHFLWFPNKLKYYNNINAKKKNKGTSSSVDSSTNNHD